MKRKKWKQLTILYYIDWSLKIKCGLFEIQIIDTKIINVERISKFAQKIKVEDRNMLGRYIKTYKDKSSFFFFFFS